MEKLNYFDLPRFFLELEKYYQHRYRYTIGNKKFPNPIGTSYSVWDALDEYAPEHARAISDGVNAEPLSREEYERVFETEWVDEVMQRVNAMHEHYKQQ